MPPRDPSTSGIASLLDEGSPIRARLGVPSSAPHPRAAYEAEARRRANAALFDAITGVGPNGAYIDVPRTATAADLEAEADARAKEQQEREASAQREAAHTAEHGALLTGIADLEKRIAARERAVAQQAMRDEMARITADRSRRGKRALDPSELATRAAKNLRKGR
jgi:hypothetical protein